jgi:hypothetical protein
MYYFVFNLKALNANGSIMNKMIKKIVLIIVFGILVTGCSAGINQINGEYVLNSGTVNEAVVIFKVSPKNKDNEVISMGFIKNAIDRKGDLYERYLMFDDSNYSGIKAIDEYFVFKVKLMNPNMANVVSSVTEKNKKTDELKLALGSGCGGEALAFSIQNPGVYYLGDVEYWNEISHIGEVKEKILISSNIDGAKDFIENYYPNLKTEPILQKAIKKFWKVGQCQPTTIYI